MITFLELAHMADATVRDAMRVVDATVRGCSNDE